VCRAAAGSHASRGRSTRRRRMANWPGTRGAPGRIPPSGRQAQSHARRSARRRPRPASPRFFTAKAAAAAAAAGPLPWAAASPQPPTPAPCPAPAQQFRRTGADSGAPSPQPQPPSWHPGGPSRPARMPPARTTTARTLPGPGRVRAVHRLRPREGAWHRQSPEGGGVSAKPGGRPAGGTATRIARLLRSGAPPGQLAVPARPASAPDPPRPPALLTPHREAIIASHPPTPPAGPSLRARHELGPQRLAPRGSASRRDGPARGGMGAAGLLIPPSRQPAAPSTETRGDPTYPAPNRPCAETSDRAKRALHPGGAALDAGGRHIGCSRRLPGCSGTPFDVLGAEAVSSGKAALMAIDLDAFLPSPAWPSPATGPGSLSHHQRHLVATMQIAPPAGGDGACRPAARMMAVGRSADQGGADVQDPAGRAFYGEAGFRARGGPRRAGAGWLPGAGTCPAGTVLPGLGRHAHVHLVAPTEPTGTWTGSASRASTAHSGPSIEQEPAAAANPGRRAVTTVRRPGGGTLAVSPVLDLALIDPERPPCTRPS